MKQRRSKTRKLCLRLAATLLSSRFSLGELGIPPRAFTYVLHILLKKGGVCIQHPIYFPNMSYPLSLPYPYHPNFQYVHYSQLIPEYAGKTYRYDYEDGNVFIIHFFDPTHRHDEGIAGPHTGFKGYYTFNYVEIAPCVYFMYWLEEVYTVSQIADFNRMRVYTHYTYDVKGTRKSLFHSGNIIEIDSFTS